MIKFTEKGQSERSEQLDYLRKQIVRIKKLNTHKGTSDWENLKGVIQGFIDMQRNFQKQGMLALDSGGYYSIQERGIKKETNDRIASDIRVAIASERSFQLVIDLIDKTDKQLEHIENEKKRVEDLFHQAKEQLE